VLQGIQDQGVDAIKGECEKDPEQRGEKETAEYGKNGMGEEEFGRGGALRRDGGVFVGRVKDRRVHGTTSVDSEPRRATEERVSPERGKGVHRLGEVGMDLVMTGFRGRRRIRRYLGPVVHDFDPYQESL
jgi:hypothetical protein